MFERYTEKARRVIFFARYEASHYGCKEIDTERLLLGLLRENKALYRWFSKATPEAIRQRVDEVSSRQPPTSTSLDLPLNSASKRVLEFAMEEADRLGHRLIGTEHLLLGLLDEEACFAAQLLREGGAEADIIRAQLEEPVQEQRSQSAFGRSRLSGAPPDGVIEIHGVRRNAYLVPDAVQRRRMYNWHWLKRPWTNVDIAVEKKTGKVSFDLSLADATGNFELVRGGWTKDHCCICRWELFESKDDAEHGIGYTNGHEWLCTECYDKFWQQGGFFVSPYPDIT